MTQWRYRITTHSADEILSMVEGPIEDVPPAVFCDDRGTCYFDAGPNPLTEAIERILDRQGQEGWELVDIELRTGQIVCFWKRSA